MLKRCFKVPSSRKTILAVCLALVLLYIILVSSFMPAVKVAFRRIAIKNADITERHSFFDHSWRLPLKQSESPNITCATTPFWSSRLLNPDGKSDLSKWDFRVRVPCSPLTIKFNNTVKREKVEFSCDGDIARMFTSQTMSSSDVKTVPFGDLCLLRVINTCCKDDDVVPNVLHYVWYGKKEMGYFQFLSFMSGVRFMRPCLILLHGEHLPFGPYWDDFIQLSPNVVHVKRQRIEVVYGRRLSFPEHGADVMRIEAIHKYGGLYLDFDEILLRPVHPLRRYNMTMGHESKDTLGNQFIMAIQNASFLDLWHQSYQNYKSGHWTWNSLITPFKLAKKYPDLIHIDGYNFTRPSYTEVKLIFDENYDWSTNYAMHLYIRWYNRPIDAGIIRTLNTTIGAVSRHVLFGNKELCDK